MEIINLDYFTKNIMVPGNIQYKLNLLNKIERYLKRTRYKLFFTKPIYDSLHDYEIETYGFKSQKKKIF